MGDGVGCEGVLILCICFIGLQLQGGGILLFFKRGEGRGLYLADPSSQGRKLELSYNARLQKVSSLKKSACP